MIYALSGKIIQKKQDGLILKINNWQIEILTTPSTLKKVKIQENKCFFVCLHLQENFAKLYGFLTEKEKIWFEKMINIPRIGPKLALNILNSINPQELENALLEKNPEALASISGIGKKTAERIILELSGEIKNFSNKTSPNKNDDNIIKALKKLGFSSQEIKELIKLIPPEIKEEKERIAYALKMASKI
ncbi:Holliday junction branch migration protein RuvA [bacterium]|nr:Holliday junction branch migration protein RuvA [bacterium]